MILRHISRPRTKFIFCAALLVGWTFGGGALAENGSSTTNDILEQDGLDGLIGRYDADHGAVSRFYEGTWSPRRIERLQEIQREWQKELAGVNFAALKQQGRIDYLLLRNHLSSELSDLDLTRKRLDEMLDLLPFLPALEELEGARGKRKSVDPRAAASTISAFPGMIKTVRSRIERGAKEKKKPETESRESAEPRSESARKAGDEAKDSAKEPLRVSPMLALRAAGAVSELRGALRNWFNFYDGYQPEFSWWLKKPFEEASKALEEYAKYLREEKAGVKEKDEDPLLGEPVGAEILAQQLANEMISYSAAELIALGEREFAWCEARMKEAARELGLDDDWKRALESVKAEFAPPGQQAEQVAEAADQAIQFVKAHDLISVPSLCEETWRLSMVSPEGQKTLPYVAYGGQRMMVAYAREEMKHEDKLMAMRGNNRFFTRIVTAHELIPGHHLQAFQSRRHRAYRSTFSTPFFVEGWALYWELRLWDLGYGRTPQERIGMLFWRMHRTARIIVSLKFHLGQMTPAEMIDFLVDRVGHERFGATSEVRRYIGPGYSPLYQCAYMIGGLQLHTLRSEVVAAGKLTERQFNDTVLSYNAIPIEFIRAGMLDVPLTPETKPGWKFRTDRALKAIK